MSDQKLLREYAFKLRQMAAELDEADDQIPDEVTCHRELGPRINTAGRKLRALAAELEKM